MTSIYDEMLSVEHRALGVRYWKVKIATGNGRSWAQTILPHPAYSYFRGCTCTLYKDRPQKPSLYPAARQPLAWETNFLSNVRLAVLLKLVDLLSGTWPRVRFHGTRLPG
jgi:hypothetical protein